MATGAVQLAFDVLGRAVAQGDDNPVVCPLSLSAALLVLLHGAGAGSETENELLGYLDVAARDEALADAHRYLKHALGTGAKDAVSSTSVVVGAGLDKRPFRLSAVDSGFDVVDAQPTPENIAAWVAKASRGSLKALFDGMSLDADVKIVLANVVRFSGRWPEPFVNIGPLGAQFHTRSGEVSRGCDWLRSPIIKNAAAERRVDGVSVLTLMYDAGGTGGPGTVATPHLAVFVYGGDDLFNLVKAAADVAARGTEFDIAAANKRVQLVVPKFALSASVDLMARLPHDLVAALKQPGADFSGMTEDAALQATLEVSRFQQKARLTVDEKGTSAEATTGVEVVSRGLPPPFERVVLDKPFVFMVCEPLGTQPLFLAAVTDPSQAV